MNILGIDPGNTQSAIVLYDTDSKKVLQAKIEDNEQLILALLYYAETDIKPFIERVAGYGMAVGKEVFETCEWAGRFFQVLLANNPQYLYRKEVKLMLCGDLRAKDKNIRQACLDRLGKEKCKGIAKDMWRALAICLTVESISNLQDWKLLKEKLP